LKNHDKSNPTSKKNYFLRIKRPLAINRLVGIINPLSKQKLISGVLIFFWQPSANHSVLVVQLKMNLPELELETLIDGCISGNRASQQKVYETYYGKMMGVCLRYARDRDEAQDLLQDGFIKVFTKIAKYNKEGSFEGWMRRIIVNNAIDAFRKNKNTYLVTNSELVLERQQEEPDEEPDDESYHGIKADDVMAALQKLSPAYKTVFNLYVIENYSHKEIAEILSISVGTSKSNLAKAKQNLRKILEKEFINRL
jgi:RNA polymerase sigma-70 factor (ECF subfamily)